MQVTRDFARAELDAPLLIRHFRTSCIHFRVLSIRDEEDDFRIAKTHYEKHGPLLNAGMSGVPVFNQLICWHARMVRKRLMDGTLIGIFA